MHRTSRTVTLDAAEILAVQGLGFLAEDPARLSRFLTLTGLTPEDVRAQAHAHPFQMAVLEHILGDESLLLTFAANASVAPETIAPALMKLQEASGGGRIR